MSSAVGPTGCLIRAFALLLASVVTGAAVWRWALPRVAFAALRLPGTDRPCGGGWRGQEQRSRVMNP